jgi:hypothetical protein
VQYLNPSYQTTEERGVENVLGGVYYEVINFVARTEFIQISFQRNTKLNQSKM